MRASIYEISGAEQSIKIIWRCVDRYSDNIIFCPVPDALGDPLYHHPYKSGASPNEIRSRAALLPPRNACRHHTADLRSINHQQQSTAKLDDHNQLQTNDRTKRAFAVRLLGIWELKRVSRWWSKE